jgi:hypothetical protein
MRVYQRSSDHRVTPDWSPVQAAQRNAAPDNFATSCTAAAVSCTVTVDRMAVECEHRLSVAHPSGLASLIASLSPDEQVLC